MTTLNTMIHQQPTSNPHITHTKHNLLPRKPLILHPFKKNTRFVPCGAQRPSEHEPEPRKASEELSASMKNHKFREFFEMLGDEPPSLRYDPFTLLIVQSLVKKQCSTMLSSLVAFIANHVEVIIKPTTEGGADVGFRWNFEWKNSNIPLGPVCSLYTSHMYTGKMLLRNGKSLIEALLHLELLKQKMKEIVMTVLQKIVPRIGFSRERRSAVLICLLALFFTAISLVLWKKTFL